MMSCIGLLNDPECASVAYAYRSSELAGLWERWKCSHRPGWPHLVQNIRPSRVCSVHTRQHAQRCY